MDKLASINIYTDGGSRGNPGPSALGVFIESENHTELASIGKTLGAQTNNIAEYSAIVEALAWVLLNLENLSSLNKINFYMDSNLAVQQLNGIYKVKNSGIRNLFFEIKKLEAQISKPIYYCHIPREKNKKADRLVNLALDGLIM